MKRFFTRDVGRYKANTWSGDWPEPTWKQIERTMKMPRDQFSLAAEHVGIPATPPPPAGPRGRSARASA